MIDAGLGYVADATTAIEVAREYEQLGIYWLEEPFEPDEYEAYAELADTVDLRDRGRRAGRDVVGLPRADRPRARRPRAARRHPLRRDHRDAADRGARGRARRRDRAARVEERHHQGRLAALQRRACRTAIWQEYCVAETPITKTLTVQRLPIEADGCVAVPTHAGPRRRSRRGRAREPQSRLMSHARPTTRRSDDDLDHDARSRPRRARGRRHPRRRQQRPAPVPGLEELVITATSGSTFTDADGRVFTDYHAAFGPPLLGHNDPDVDAAAAAAGRSVDLMGVGVTRVEIELAERLVAVVPSLEKVLLTCTGQRGDLPRAPARAHGDRPPPRDQVPGLLPRLARLGRDERDLARRARRQQGPALAGDAPRGRSTRRSSAGSTTPTTSSARSTSTTATSPRSSSSRSRTTSAPSCRSPASSSGCASSRRSTAPCSSSTR